ncbi:MAG: site-specific DNA-methyltransferase [Euryarchaeota archaeon]|nr:site-specific DNA-methyltransferase [Euryarchaeota archaeon]
MLQLLSLLKENKSIIVNADIVNVLGCIPSESVQCIVTSPPYWGIRDYCIDCQIGHEDTIDEYIDKLTEVFLQCKRILKTNGVMWLNIGDVYTSGNRGYRCNDKKNGARAMSFRPKTPDGLKRKELIGVPWRLAFALQKEGWYLRCDMIWNKPNALPESVKDRPSRSHEYVFMMSKSEKYYYNKVFLSEYGIAGAMKKLNSVINVKNKRSGLRHYAAFPESLIEPFILSSCKAGDYVMDPFFGIGTVGVVCEKCDRRYLGVELNHEYIKMALSRGLRSCDVL